MKKLFSSFVSVSLCMAFVSCQELVPDDISGIYIKSDDVFVEYTSAKVFGDIRVSENPERISEVRVYYGASSEDLSKSVLATYDTTNGFSADLVSLEDGMQYYYRIDIIVGKTPIMGQIKDFITFPQGPVDLDLPSGKKWASQNLGALNPTERGDHYAWGEVETKERYDWATYKYCDDGDYTKLTKYTTREASAYGGVDNLSELQSSDDAASVNLGSSWKIPSLKEWIELIDNCHYKYSKINGIGGLVIRSSKDMNNNKKFIFLPEYPGAYSGTQFKETGSSYWTSTLKTDATFNDLALVIQPSLDDRFYTSFYTSRCYGLNIRAIYLN